MTTFRRYLYRHRMRAAWLLAITLCMKLLVPSGFMPVANGGSIGIAPCSGMGPMVAMPGMAHDARDQHATGTVDTPCGFGGLSTPSLDTVDSFIVAMRLPFVVSAIVPRRRPPTVDRPKFLTPHLRGPPTAG